MVKEWSNAFSEVRKTESLEHDLSGKWSRMIIDEHRLIYKVDSDAIYFYSAKYHYWGDKKEKDFIHVRNKIFLFFFIVIRTYVCYNFVVRGFISDLLIK